MNGVAAHHHRKRRSDGARDNPSSSSHRRRRLHGLSHFPAVRPFGLRFVLGAAPHHRPKRRRGNARHLASAPCLRRRRSTSSIVVPRHFPALRPFVLRYLLAVGPSAPRRRRKPAVVDMGNYVSRLLGKSTGDGGLGVWGWVGGSREVGDLTVATKVESEKSSVSRRGIGDSGMASLETLVPPEKRGPHYKETVKRTKMLGERLEVGFEMRPQERKLANLPRAPVDRPKRDLPELFTPLTNKEESEVNNFLYGSSYSKKVLVMHDPSNIEITAEKLWCLRPRGWLNDEVINLYLELLKERAEREPEKFLKCHFFNTFFYKKLTCGKTGYDYQSVRRWTTLKKLGYGLVKCDKIFVPVHRDIHWCLAIINMKDRTFQYLDSLGGMDHAVLRILARYIMDELKDKSNIGIDTSSWLEEVSDSLPLQQNGWDCGMFMLKFIDFHSRGLGLSFSQEHMEYFRKRTAKEILRLRAD